MNRQYRIDHKPEKINNVMLPAGSPMYFYCKFCENLSDVVSESYVTPPKKICDECMEEEKLKLDKNETLIK